MRAYYIYDEKKDRDYIAIPETNVLADVDRSKISEFIAVRPDFNRFQGSSLNAMQPAAFGRIVATRDDDGDVCVAEAGLWRQRMQVHLA